MAVASAPTNIGLVLTGGGARAAYQAGALRAGGELAGRAPIPSPFRTIAGISAGSINAAYLAARARNFADATEAAWKLWAGLRSDHILKTGVVSLSRLGIGWVRDLSLGGAFQGSRSTYLLDTQPLRSLLAREIDFAAIE